MVAVAFTVQFDDKGFVLVRENGPAYSMRLQSSTGSEELDRWVTTNLEARKVQPGLIDGTLVTMEHQEAVTIKQR